MRLYAAMASVALVLLNIPAAFAQWIGPAFDTGCYYPGLGVKGQIEISDALSESQLLGRIIKNLGRGEDGKERILIEGLNTNPNGTTIVTVEPGFDVTKLDGMRLPFQFRSQFTGRRILFVGPIHHANSHDILIDWGQEGRIYWDLGNFTYDSVNYTDLRSNRELQREVAGYDLVERYIARLSQDSVVDIVFGSANQFPQDSCYLEWFRGGTQLFDAGKTAYSDSQIFLWPHVVTASEGVSRTTLKGDFRGTGREDLIAGNDFGDLFFYRNDPPFSLEKLAHSLEFDTLMTTWQNMDAGYQRYFGQGGWVREWSIAMKALAKKNDDLSEDFLAPISIMGERPEDQRLRIFRGGSGFGTKRLLVEEPDAFIRAPHYYDYRFDGFPKGVLTNAGDMNGSGNNTLFAPGEANRSGFDAFYVAGDVLDDQIDMFLHLEHDDSGPILSLDTLDANGDGLTDILYAVGVRDRCRLVLYCGSGDIRRRGTLSVEGSSSYVLHAFRSGDFLHISQANPQPLTVKVYDLLGRMIDDDDNEINNLGQIEVPLGGYRGVLIIETQNRSGSRMSKLIFLN